VNAAGLVLARGAERLGVGWAATPLTTVSAPRASLRLRLSRLLQLWLLHQRQTMRFDSMDSARATAGAQVRDLAMAGASISTGMAA